MSTCSYNNGDRVCCDRPDWLAKLPIRRPSSCCCSSPGLPPCAVTCEPTGEPDAPPTSWMPVYTTPTVSCASWYIVPPLGRALIMSGVTARTVLALWTSTSGEPPDTV